MSKIRSAENIASTIYRLSLEPLGDEEIFIAKIKPTLISWAKDIMDEQAELAKRLIKEAVMAAVL